ncbi:melanotransferrin [Erpetoichthys calabaricus]|uniref:Melanotransferrin n=1 Tax=Erpetoichthys calabaricus TaxID=27687 RepID=A0A8C4S687_ERPCA|nr:melanotransferrin [Erpetoichthys calabaricus]
MMKTVATVILVVLQWAFTLGRVRWCTISDLELRKCNDMANAFSQAGIQPALSCIAGMSSIDCIEKIAAKEADAVTLNGGSVYEAGKRYNLKPVVGEKYDEEPGLSYYGVAVIRKSNNNFNFINLKGKKSCHTGLGRTVGWNVPMGYLISSGKMSVMGCDVLKGASDFFAASCVPGANVDGYPPSLCQLCIGDESGNNKCTKNAEERYFNYSGAFRCLAEGAGDVAFVKHTTVLENTNGANSDQWAKNLLSQDFQLLCPNGLRAEIGDYRRCNLAKVPSQAIVIRPDANGEDIFKMLNDGQMKFGRDGSTHFKMFDSSAYSSKDLLFKDTTTALIKIEKQTYEAWLGNDYLNALSALDCSPGRVPEYLRWCVLSTQELWKCADMATNFSRKSLTPKIQCVSGSSTTDCLQKIKNKEADAITLDGGFIYKAGKMEGLVPAAAEAYSDTNAGSSYFAVAVVKRSAHDSFTFNDLKGRKSCHTGYGRTAGWNIPISILIEKGLIRATSCDLAKAAGEFFSASCVPGANKPGFPARLCELCVGDNTGAGKCESSSVERYYSYSGAFRCLAEDKGEVAFVKHSTVLDNTDGKNTEAWAAGLKSTDFQLLCPNGARAEVTNYATCNLAQVPAHTVMVHPDTSIYAIYGLLDKAQLFFANDSNLGEFRMFDSSKYEASDLIFKDSTLHIVSVEEKKTYEAWLGQGYMSSLERLECAGIAVSSVPVIIVAALSFLLL